MSSIWKSPMTPQQLNDLCRNTMHDAVGLSVTEVGEAFLIGTFTVDSRICQPFRIMHGGASAVMAESLASLGTIMAYGDQYHPYGISVTCNHTRPGLEGEQLTATCKPISLGRSVSVWESRLVNPARKLVSISTVTVMAKSAKG